MKIYNVDDVGNRVVKCHNCGYKLLILQICKDCMNVMNPNILTYCPICGEELYTIEDLDNKIMDLEYKIMCEEDKCQKHN